MSSSLFRDEVLDSDHKRALGQVVLIQPLSHTLLVIVASCILVALCLALVLCHYTRRTEVKGVLEPRDGVVKLYAPQNGRLVTSHVREGQEVRKGEVLLIFTSDRGTATGQVMEENEDAQLKIRLGTLEKERRETRVLQQADSAVSSEGLASLRRAQENLISQIKVQANRVQVVEDGLARFEKLQQSGFVPELQVQSKREEMLDQQLRLQAMQNQKITNDAEIHRVARLLAVAPAREAVAEAQFARNISSTQTELNNHIGGHAWSLLAPCDGVIASFSINKNQTASVGVPLITIIPRNSQLQAHLYAPSRALGFIGPGKHVKMKLDAYPYQRFGMLTGQVESIAGTPALLSEISSSARLIPSGISDEPAYVIQVQLDQQTIHAYGLPRALKPGMQISAEIELDTRRLYEWIMEPLLSR